MFLRAPGNMLILQIIWQFSAKSKNGRKLKDTDYLNIDSIYFLIYLMQKRSRFGALYMTIYVLSYLFQPKSS